MGPYLSKKEQKEHISATPDPQFTTGRACRCGQPFSKSPALEARSTMASAEGQAGTETAGSERGHAGGGSSSISSSAAVAPSGSSSSRSSSSLQVCKRRRRRAYLSYSVYDCDICAQSTVQWKGESEETVKTRRNALRVIVQKLRNIWPVRRARAGPMPSSAQPWGASDTDAHLRMRTAHASASAFRVHTLAVLRI